MKIENSGAMGNFDRITSLDDLPSDKVLLAYIKEAMKLNENEIKLPLTGSLMAEQELEVYEEMK